MSEPFLAEIRPFAFNFPPRGWAHCDGQILPINQNQSLFSLLGTTYGGDGRTNFGLPDLRGRVPLHEGQGPGLSNRRLGERGGAETVNLTAAEMPSHTHADGADPNNLEATVQANSEAATSSDPTVAGTNLAAANAYNSDPPSVDMSAASHQLSLTDTGGSQGHNNMPPVTTLNFCIAMQGVFPSRN